MKHTTINVATEVSSPADLQSAEVQASDLVIGRTGKIIKDRLGLMPAMRAPAGRSKLTAREEVRLRILCAVLSGPMIRNSSECIEAPWEIIGELNEMIDCEINSLFPSLAE